MKKESKEIVLDTLSLKNFKGVFDQIFHLNGSTNIYGANESGKSTFLTAFLWLLTGKDEFDRQDYEIKNTQKPELNRQGHEVEGVFRVNDQQITLKRIYWEKWSRPRGASQEVFKGHETEYFVNDVQCATAAEYQAKVEEMIPTSILKMITNPNYFNSLKWQDQRRGLISIAGEVTNEDIFRAIATPDRDFGTLIMTLNAGKKIDSYKDELSAKILKLKKASVEFAPRIDEVKRGKPEVQEWDVLQNSLIKKAVRIEKIDNIISDAVKALQEKQKAITDKRTLLFKKQSALSEIRNRIRSKIEQDRSEGPNKVANLKSQASSVNNEIIALEREIANRTANIDGYKKEMARLDEIIAAHRVAWSKINSEKFEFDDSKCECPTCKQVLPADQIEEKKETLLKNFNKSVADRKAEEVAKSDQRKKEKKQQEDMILSATGIIQTLELEIKSRKEKQAELNEQLDTLLKEQSSKALDNIEVATDALLKVNADALNLQDEIGELETEIAGDTEALGDPDNYEKERQEKRELQAEIDELKKKLALKTVIEEADKRIQQLDDEWKATSQEIANLEQLIFDIDSYTRAQMEIIEARVNGMFKYVQWRLFETQVNGQVIESCVCTYKDVPYPTLNTAAKLLAGLDVLNTISQHYGIYAPVICDNRESTSWIPDIRSQVIGLFVSPEDKSLRIEQIRQVKKAS